MRLKSLPSIDLLRSFEAAARHLSFTKAAKELFLTQSAVSRQVKSLEQHLGLVLFHREIRQLQLTEPGRHLHNTVDQVLRQLETTVATLKGNERTRTLGIGTTVSFAALWLIPRLGAFRARYPDIDVRVSATSELQDIRRRRLDIAIRYAKPGRLEAGARLLFTEQLFAVSSPCLVNTGRVPLRDPKDLESHVLLHMDDPCGDWPWYTWTSWLQNMGLSHLRPAGGLRFSQYDQVIQAALDGQGVALGRSPLIDRLLRQGRLVAPFSEEHVLSGAYHLVTESNTQADTDVARFIDWLYDEIATES